MHDEAFWSLIEGEARAAWRGEGHFLLPAYSELMPAQFVGWKPYAPGRGPGVATLGAREIDEYEWAHELSPGFDRIAEHVLAELGKLMRGDRHALSHTLLDGNPAWPAELAQAAGGGKLADEPIVIALALALSRTHDDKGNDRWTLFGASHAGAELALEGLDEAALVRWAGGTRWAHADATSLAGIDTIVTLTPFAELPAAIRAAYLARAIRIVPTPASLVFFHHPRYRALADELPRATQIPLLHLFPRCEDRYAIRIPQSGWLDEGAPAGGDHRHRVVSHIARTHRWQRSARDAGMPEAAFHDKVSTALFSTDPDVIGLYDKPMARNAQIWTEDYHLLLDGPTADVAAIARAERAVLAGGRFGYRMYFPPMRAGLRDLFWHVPVIAKHGERFPGAPAGVLTAELPGAPPIRLVPERLARPAHLAAAALAPVRARPTPSHNARKLLDARDLLGEPLDPSFARSLLRLPKHASLDDFLSDAIPEVRRCVGSPADPGEPVVLDRLGDRAFEEHVWRTIASLAEGAFRQKENADGIAVNRGKTGGPAAKAAKVQVAERRDLEALGDFLHDRHRALIAAHHMTGRAEVVDHVFRWATDFAFPWMEGWAKNQTAPSERNIVMMIPGNDRGQAVVMADHYDTAYMEDCYDADRGGDQLRAPAWGADDNHSATTALLLAAEHLLPLSRAGKLARDVWLVHLTGEEFPADSLGARAICQALVEQRLAFTAEDGTRRDVSRVEIAGVYVLDMIGHNTHRDRDVFQIAPGEGAAAMRLAWRAQRANQRWNRAAAAWNVQRPGLARAERKPDGSTPPPPFAHLPLHGEVRTEWEPTSTLYNTDGQVFSDLGVPVVLFMENYDISRTGYHDTLDTMANIDLDYCAAVTAIAIESVADAASAPAAFDTGASPRAR
ncbi:MAG TPA: M28 family peptidase [Kofleriaceae bacterium]|jgi:hypothetical protein|nr:M28 family peptidase [Kofleriaceae bacterium]